LKISPEGGTRYFEEGMTTLTKEGGTLDTYEGLGDMKHAYT